MSISKSKTFILRSFGCQMNAVDSDHICMILEENGWTQVEDERDARMVIFNTCSVRQHAEDRVFGRLNFVSSLKKHRPSMIIGVMGCMVNSYKQDLLKRYPLLDFVVGTKDFRRISDIIEEVESSRSQMAFITDEHSALEYHDFRLRKGSVSAFVPIMRGCDNFCTYCIVPYVRGREVSRPVENVIKEIRFLADKGVREVILLGQNVNSYGKGLSERIDFAGLLKKVEEIDGIEFIRFMTSHPKDVSKDLFDVMADSKKIERHLHLPLQSGSDNMLKAMNRNYSLESYLDNIKYVRSVIPDISITTDIIVGFCGESRADFEATRNIMEEVRFENAFIFKYSSRKGTKAFDSLSDDVTKKEKERRHAELFKMQTQIRKEILSSAIGKTEPVLFHSVSKKDKSQIRGLSTSDRNVVCSAASDMIGKVAQVRYTKLNAQTLVGELV